LWAAGVDEKSGMCEAPDRPAVRRSFVLGLMFRLESGEVVTTAEGSCGEHPDAQKQSVARRAHLTLVR
jgi:hypothetical protein